MRRRRRISAMMADMYRVAAHNWATESENKIHDDAVASRYGFKGGLVPGVAVWAYMTHPPAARWGRDWLENGGMTATFRSPVYEGETVSVQMDDDGKLSLCNEAGSECASGSAVRKGVAK